MRSSRAFLTATTAAVALALVVPAFAHGPTIGPVAQGGALPEVCFAPGTDPALVDAYAQAFAQSRAHGSDLAVTAAFYASNRWSATATNGFGLAQGDPTTLTWSIVPDGTPIEGAIGEPSAPSNLRAYLNSIYGHESAWLPLFQQVFDRWAELTGVSYVYEPADDGATIGQAGPPGVLGVRADVRIGGHALDGDFRVLAYNYYPNNGDMVLDTSDVFFTNTSGSSLRLRNTIAHEHGHGLGLAHVCPVNQTKLMEPFVTLLFDGPQHDDVLGANRGYGDDLEHNDHMGSSSNLGALANGTVHVQGLSADDDGDVDTFRFRVGPGKKVSITATPIGFTYSHGPQNLDGSCTPGTPFNSRGQNDLAVQILDVNGTTVLGQANASGAGLPETLDNVALPSGSATYYARVLAGPSNAAQLYDLSLSIDDVVPPPDDIFSDGFEGSDLSAWSAAKDGGGDLYTSPAAAIAGARGLAAHVDDTGALWVEDDTPDSEARYRVRFSFDPNGFAPAKSKKLVHFFHAVSRQAKQKKLLILQLRRRNGQHELRLKVFRVGGMIGTKWRAISDAPHSIEIDWQKATGPGSADGHVQMWIDGTPVAWIGGLDNPARFIDAVRLGVWKLRPTSSGTLYFDRFVSRRTTYIGP